MSEFVTKMVEKEKGKGNMWLSSCRSETGIFFIHLLESELSPVMFHQREASRGGELNGCSTKKHGVII